MESDPNSVTDLDLRDAILAGISASETLESRFRHSLEHYLVGKCGNGEGRSLEQAVEIANETLADCFRRSPSLLERWSGEDNLGAFLRTVAHNRLKSWWRSPAGGATESTEEGVADQPVPPPEDLLDATELARAAAALHKGMEIAAEQCPEGLVFMRLKGLHGVDQRKIAACWGHHETHISRRIKEAMTMIRTTALARAAAMRCELSVELLQQALQRDPSILFGSGATGGLPENEELLRRLPAEGTDAAVRAEAVRVMGANAASLAYFAQLLNREDAGEAVIVRDPALAGVGARLQECVRRTLGQLQPAEAAGLFTPLMDACFAVMLDQVAADGGTLWWLSADRTALEAVYNPREPEIIGRRQPLVSGIVSLVLGTGEAALVTAANLHASHSPAIDVALRKTTGSMIAVPFVIAGTTCGVVTTVKRAGEPPFSAEDAANVSHHAEILCQLMLATVRERILGCF